MKTCCCCRYWALVWGGILTFVFSLVPSFRHFRIFNIIGEMPLPGRIHERHTMMTSCAHCSSLAEKRSGYMQNSECTALQFCRTCRHCIHCCIHHYICSNDWPPGVQSV